MALDENSSWWHPDPGPVPLVDLTVGSLLDDAATRWPEHEALVIRGYGPQLDVRWTYRQFRDRVDRLAAALVASGVRAGEPVALWAPNVAYWPVCEFAVAKAGAVLVTVNPTYRAQEACHVLADSTARLCLLWPEFGRLSPMREMAAIRSELPHLREVISLAGPSADVTGLDEFLSRVNQRALETVPQRAGKVGAGDIAQLQYTSGTTGRPKGAELTHRAIVNNARQSAWLWRIDHDDRWCNPLPLFHTAGCAMLTLGAVSAGATHLMLVRFDADKTLDVIAVERASVLETVPTILSALVERQRTRHADLSSLRLVGTSGAPTPQRLGQVLADEWHVPLRVLYGSTEIAPTASGTAPDEPADLGWTTVGKPLPWTETRVVDQITRTPVPVGEPGELEVRGYQVMAGYHERPDATREVLDIDGWFRTGDLACQDAHGYLRIVGRLKDVIIRGGENIYPAEIEDLIREYPGVLDAAVVGVPDAFFGEQACAAVRVRDGVEMNPDDLREWLAARVTHQKVPRYIRLVAALPQTASGKIQKFRLREQMLGTLPASEATERAK